MFFKRARKDKLTAAAPAADPSSQSPQQTEAPGPASRPGALASSALRRLTDPATLGFKTTAELGAPAELFGQHQALAALLVGASIRSNDHNIVIIGATGSAELRAIHNELQSLAATRPGPSDWVYVADFDNPHAPRALQLPAGSGRLLATAMDDAVGEMRSAIVATLASDSYQTRWRAIDAECQARHRAGLDALVRTADAHSIALLRTPMGYAVAPAHEGGVVLQETFANMPPTMQADVRAHINALEADLSELLENAPQVDRQRRVRLSKLNREVLLSIARAALAEPRQVFAGNLAVMDYFAAVEADVLANANSFLPTIDISDILGAEQLAPIEDGRFDRYRVNVFVSRSPNGLAVPIEQDLAPSLDSLFGALSGSVTTAAAHMQLVLGTLHRANGGFLLLDARELTASPRMWSKLLATLKSGTITPMLANGSAQRSSIPLDVKIILLSDADHRRSELATDARYAELFKVEVAFAQSVARTLESERDLARTIASIASQEGLEPLEAAAVAELIDLSARTARHQDLLSPAVRDFTGLMCEADVQRTLGARKVTSRDDVAQACLVLAKRRAPGTSLLKTAGDGIGFSSTQAAVGMIGCLQESHVESFAAAMPNPRVCRVSARILSPLLRPGSVDISRINYGGSAGVSSLAAYLAAEFGNDGSIALSAALELLPLLPETNAGDDATCAELMALLSAICELPLPQTIAVAGTFDQFGTVRIRGDINEAVEEFFDAIMATGIKFDRGVVIPAAALPSLMLRRDVLDAVAVGDFKVWSVDTVAECFAVLTGQAAGNRGCDGRFAEGDVYRRVEERLHVLNERAGLHQAAPKVAVS